MMRVRIFATAKNHMARIYDYYASISLSFCNILCCLREIWKSVRQTEDSYEGDGMKGRTMSISCNLYNIQLIYGC